MVNRVLVVTATLLLSLTTAHGREAQAPKAQPNPSASTTDPLDVPRGIQDWVAKSVDDILDEDAPARGAKPPSVR